MHEHEIHHVPTIDEIKKQKLQALIVIVDRVKNKQVTEILQARHILLHFVCLAEGTATSEIMDLLGLGATDKAVTLCIIPKGLAPELLEDLSTKLNLHGPGGGIAFTVPLSGISSQALQLLDQNIRESIQHEMDKEVESMRTGASHDLILAVIDQGCSEDLMTVAKAAGARGGTVIHARRISTEASVKFFGIAIQAEKEIVAILTAREKKTEIMKALNHHCGTHSEAKGIFLSLPVDSIAGMSELAPEEE